MGEGAASPDRGPPMQVELLHESVRTRVTRVFLSGRTAVRKEPLGPDGQRRLQHELAFLERLRGVMGVAQLLDEPRYPGSITLADGGRESLAHVVKPLPVDDLIGLAEQLARAVADMHGRGVMHRDICPANIVRSARGAPCLVDFASATSLAEIRPEFAHHTQILGALSYSAPEQTGRTGRPVDHRADLYALGATLYDLATGEPPFGYGDALRLIHDHLARVPKPPSDVNPAVGQGLSQIIMHLLEKEPDDRYQSANGLVHDLVQLRELGSSTTPAPRVGARDFPMRLVPPSRLIGRDDEVATLQAAFDDALRGECRGVMVGGDSGVGKTALIDHLRQVVTGNDGWFVAGKFDQYRRDLEFDGVFQAFGALGRLLLSEPDDELAELRERMLSALGPNASMASAVLPEFAVLLGVPAETGDPLTTRVRVQHSAVDMLRAVASPKRPVMLFVDDLQWASTTSIGIVDLVMREQVPGLLLVGAHRTGMDPAHPLASLLARWRDQPDVTQLQLGNLPAPSQAALVAEILRVEHAAAGALAEIIEPHTHGNPYETAELLNRLRQVRILVSTSTGWRWDELAVRSLLGQSDLAVRPMAPLAAIPPSSREVVEMMASLGGRAELSVLAVASAEPADVVERLLAPALEEGVLVAESGVHGGVRFRHDRIREAVLAEVDAKRRRTMQLTLARRLVGVPELFAVAAEQYLPVIDAVTDPAERSQLVALLRRAAEQASLVGGYAQVQTLLTGALQLADADDTATLVELRTARHAALYSLGRLDEADEDYRIIDRLGGSVLQRVDATCVQVRSLTGRKLLTEAIELAVGTLRELGVSLPESGALPELLARYFDYLYRWLDHTDVADDLARPDITDPNLLAVTCLLNAAFPPAHWAGDAFTRAWLSLEAVRILVDHGTARGVLFPASYSTVGTIALRDDYEAAYRVARRILTLGEARGYEPETSQARFVFARFSCWFEPLEVSAQHARLAHEALAKCGDMATAGYAIHYSMTVQLDCAPTLDDFAAVVDTGLAFARRVGNEQLDQWLEDSQWLTTVLRGESSAAASAVAEPIDGYADNPTAQFSAHLPRAVAAAIIDDPAALTRHTFAAMQSLDLIPGNYATALARLLRGLALAADARTAQADERDRLLSELDDVIRWLAARAAGAPENFGHMLRVLEAERAWSAGEFGAAALAFDAARGEVAGRQRAWHRALITERAARFALAQGLQHAGFELLAHARQEYLAWGATAKVAQLDWAYPALRRHTDLPGESGADPAGDLSRDGSMLSTGTIDLMAILAASQALSSETSIEGLHARVVHVLAAMTGATAVQLVLWDEDRQVWLRPAQGGSTGLVGSAGSHHDVPMSVLRYAQRLTDPLVVADVMCDSRFAGDPYFADVDRCSLVALPILSRGRLRAVLLLENRLIRGAFTAERLDAVNLIAGQLAVSLDNAQLYSELAASRTRLVAAGDQTRRQIERDLHDGAQQRLVSLVLELGMAQAEVSTEDGELRMRLGHAGEQAREALKELRDLSRGIHPAILTEGGLGKALRAMTRRSPISVELDLGVEDRLPDHVEISAYYIVAEALTNATKHSGASVVRVCVTAEQGGGALRLEVVDDGVGGAEFSGGTGLMGLKDRVDALGGRIDLHSPRGGGTTLHVTLPLKRANGES